MDIKNYNDELTDEQKIHEHDHADRRSHHALEGGVGFRPARESAQPPHQHSEPDQRHAVAGGAVQDRYEHMRPPAPDLEMGRKRSLVHDDPVVSLLLHPT